MWYRHRCGGTAEGNGSEDKDIILVLISPYGRDEEVVCGGLLYEACLMADNKRDC